LAYFWISFNRKCQKHNLCFLNYVDPQRWPYASTGSPPSRNPHSPQPQHPTTPATSQTWSPALIRIQRSRKQNLCPEEN
jgi:hypothetical protein